MSIIDAALEYLACPNDGSSLSIGDGRLSCKVCSEYFKIINENTVELVPHKSAHLSTNDTYSKIYSELTNVGYPTDPSLVYWGLASKSVPVAFVQEIRNNLKKLVDKKIVCDVGAGNGDYSLVLAEKSKLVFHCDLNAKALALARDIAIKRRLDNILFIRCDYFYLPFKQNSLPCVTCIDVLERGQEHDVKLLKQITSKAQTDAIIMIDFHSKERVRLTHATDLENRYSKNEISTILPKFGLQILEITGRGFLPQIKNLPTTVYQTGNFVCRVFFPPARWLVVTRKAITYQNR